EVSIARECPQRKKLPIAVISQIENAWKAGCSKSLLIPQAAFSLCFGQVSDTPFDRRIVYLASGHQAQQSPWGLGGRAGGWLVTAIVELVAGTALAPTPINVLNR